MYVCSPCLRAQTIHFARSRTSDGVELRTDSVRITAAQPVHALYGNSTYSAAHYELNRCLTIRELARLQSFPDEHEFPTNRRAARQQIQNAVPVLLAYSVGKCLIESYNVT